MLLPPTIGFDRFLAAHCFPVQLSQLRVGEPGTRLRSTRNMPAVDQKIAFDELLTITVECSARLLENREQPENGKM